MVGVGAPWAGYVVVRSEREPGGSVVVQCLACGIEVPSSIVPHRSFLVRGIALSR